MGQSKLIKFNQTTLWTIVIVIIFAIIQFQPVLDPASASGEIGETGDETGNSGFFIDAEPTSNRGKVSRAQIEREVADSEVMYAIIAPENFTEYLIPLVNWKTYKGVPAKLFTLESIYANYTDGYDNAEDIHKFLRDLHSKSSAFKWLLLVGDADVVPTRWLKAEATNYELDEEYISDLYYACLESDWDKDNDGKYGEGTPVSNPKFEGDWTINLNVGRLPVGNPT